MANTLTNIMDMILARALLALRKEIVLTRVVNTDYSTEAAKKGEVITIELPFGVGVTDVTPSNIPPELADKTPPVAQIPLNRWRKSEPFHLSDKDFAAINANAQFVPGGVSEAVSALAEDVNGFLASLYTEFYGFVGTPGTTPFQTDTRAARDARKVLNQQKALKSMRSIILDYEAYATAMGLDALANASKKGDANVMQRGEIVNALGWDWAEDGQIATHTPNAVGSGALTINGAHGTTGVKTISVAKGAGDNWSALQGDIVTIAGHDQTYVVTAPTTVTQGANTDLPIEPGLKVALSGGEAISVKAAHVANLAIQRNAIGLAIRSMALQPGSKRVVRTMPDPISGLVLRMEMIDGYKATMWELDILYGAAVVRRELGARIAG